MNNENNGLNNMGQPVPPTEVPGAAQPVTPLTQETVQPTPEAVPVEAPATPEVAPVASETPAEPVTPVTPEAPTGETTTAPTEEKKDNKLAIILIVFAVVLAIGACLWFFVFNKKEEPVKKIIKKRQDYIDDNIKQSELAKTRANDNIIKSEETLTASHKQANEIIEQAKLDAEAERSRILEETSLAVSKMKQDAEIDIAQSKEDAKEEIRKEMVNLALDASSEILSRNVNTKDNEKLADDFIRSIEK